MRWQGATVLITGASRGIGRATARAVASRGANVALVARTRTDLEATLEQCRGHGVVLVADVGDRRQVIGAVEAAREQLGPIDVLVNCAGIGAAAEFALHDMERIDAVVATNLLGVLYTTRAVVPAMIERGRGHVVNVGSISGRVPVPLESVYTATKFGVAGFTEALAVELAVHGVCVSLITPGPVRTDFDGGIGSTYVRRRPRPMAPERVADAIVAAVDHRHHEITRPRWLWLGRLADTLAPPLYRFGVARALRKTPNH